MSQHIFHALKHWYPLRDNHQWLLATVINTRGSSYRKAGAMMLFNDGGGQFGIVSGGCLESDLLHQARKCWLRNQSMTITYDMQEEGDVAWRLGIGCGGEITLLLQPVSALNGYLALDTVLQNLERDTAVTYNQSLACPDTGASVGSSAEEGVFSAHIAPPFRLAVFGGGVDAQPLAQLAHTLGWQTTVNDPRARYARPLDFPRAHCTEEEARALAESPWYHASQVAVVMHHQVGLDAQVLRIIADSPPADLRYLALLGPVHRAERVLKEAGLKLNDFTVPLQAPAGLNLGGELPESIALSMLAQAHAILHETDATPLAEQ